MCVNTTERAGIEDGMNILDLGCGWGSLSLWIAEHYPGSTVTAVSNSAPQRRHIERLAAARGLDNLQVITQDMNDFAPGHAPDKRYDRVVSVEMFEHMSNWRELLTRISSWLEPDGRVFLHVFSHRHAPYRFDGSGKLSAGPGARFDQIANGLPGLETRLPLLFDV